MELFSDPYDKFDLENVTWPPYNEAEKKFMNIAETLTLETGLYENRYRIWDSIFPLLD